MARNVAVRHAINQRWVPQFSRNGRNYRDINEFIIDCTKYRSDLANPSLTRQIAQLFHTQGLVYLTNTHTTDTQRLQSAFKDAMEGGTVYQGGANPRSHIEGNVYDTGVDMSSYVHYHHEMAYMDYSVKLLAFFCKQMSPNVKGETYVSDNIAVTNALANTQLGRKLREKNVCYIRKLTDREHFKDDPLGVYNHWQKSFLTEDPKVAERLAKEKGLKVEWGPNRHMITRYYAPSFEYCPQIDRNLLFASLADHSIWFDTWPNVQQVPYKERPLWMTYGDDTDFTNDEVSEFTEIYDDYGIALPWTPGDAGLVCNYRWLHGRPIVHLEPGEKRELGVVLGNPLKRMGAIEGKY